MSGRPTWMTYGPTSKNWPLYIILSSCSHWKMDWKLSWLKDDPRNDLKMFRVETIWHSFAQCYQYSNFLLPFILDPWTSLVVSLSTLWLLRTFGEFSCCVLSLPPPSDALSRILMLSLHLWIHVLNNGTLRRATCVERVCISKGH